jgi:agmatinase
MFYFVHLLIVLSSFFLKYIVSAHSYSQQQHFHSDPTIDLSTEPWFSKYGAQEDLDFSGHLSFSHLAAAKCLENNSTLFDIAILGFPFDNTVTYRPGARFGPFSIRSGSRRQQTHWWDLTWGNSPSGWGAGMVDCGDVSDHARYLGCFCSGNPRLAA